MPVCVCVCMYVSARFSGHGAHRIKPSLHAVLQLQTLRVIRGNSRGHLAYRTAASVTPFPQRAILLNRENKCNLSFTALGISDPGLFVRDYVAE